MKKKNLLTLVAAFATVFATTMATSACIYFFYQPEEPESLRDK
jgi:cyclic lactone autoinducer peptide